MSVKMAAVGDITLGDHPMCIGFGAHSQFKKQSPDYPFLHVRSHFQTCDIVFGNLECTISLNGLTKNDLSTLQMRGQPSYVEGLKKKSGVTVVNLANNHSLQHGKEPFIETLELLKDYGIQYCGVSEETHLHAVPAIIEQKNIKIGILGYSLRPRQYFKEPPLYTEGIEANIISDLHNLKEKVDCIITSFHWGDEFIQEPALQEIELARKCIDCGADLIIGHHPHVLRGIEKYRHGYIAYSLGNFICDMIWDDKLRESLILFIEFTKSGIKNLDYLPVRINNNYQPEVLNGQAGEKLRKFIQKLSEDVQKENLINKKLKIDLYRQKADDFQREYRSKSHRYFLKNFYRFPLKILIQQIKTYFLNRLDEFTNRRD